jgi:glycosyltransferase involved in cell wall biosynthesis
MLTIVRKIRDRLGKLRTLENVCHSMHTQRCLLCYVVAPFLHDGEPNPAHQNQWQAREIARQLDRLGFCVDVINYDNLNPCLRHQYDLVIDIHPGSERPYLSFLKPGGTKIAYITGSNPVVANQAEQKRLDDLFERRRVRLAPRRQADLFPEEVLERFDALFMIGSQQTLDTYQDLRLPRTFLLPNTSIAGLDAGDDKRSSRNFMFLASGGQVHKGLDLLLELFSRHAELQLYVCSSFKNERDFCRLYKQELFETQHIHPVGFLDITGSRFREIAASCAWMLLPSCAEALAGSVAVAMSAGLTPVVSHACGYPQDQVVLMPDCRIETIEQLVLELSEMPPEQMQSLSRRSVGVAAQQYAPVRYSQALQQALEETVRGM